MDDRDLEARLRARLHDRFDTAQPSPELAAAVRQSMRTQPRPVSIGGLRMRPVQLGWLLAAAVIAVLAVANLDIGRLMGPGSPTPSPQPNATRGPATSRSFVVMPAAGPVPSKTDSSTASDVLVARLRALGFGNFSSAGGYGIVFELPIDGASDEVVRAVLSATGDVSFVPLPAADYGEGKLSAAVDHVLPKDEPSLFDRADIVSIVPSDHEGQSGVDIELSPTARTAFSDYTSQHVGATFAVVIDRVVALLPTINEPISGGTVTISGASDDTTFVATAAILVGGALPESWAQPRVPAILSAEEIAAQVERNYSVPGTAGEELTVIRAGAGFQAVWRVSVSDLPLLCFDRPVGPTFAPCSKPVAVVIVVDAVNGGFVSEEQFPPSS